VRFWRQLLGGAGEPREERSALTTLEDLLSDRRPTWAGEGVDQDSALRHAAVWACVKLLADTVATLPVAVYRQGEPDPIATPLIIEEPGARQPLHEFLYAVMVSLLTRGNAYGLIVARQGTTMLPTQIEVLFPDFVSINVNERSEVVYRFGGREIDAADIWHVRCFTEPGVVLGLSPVEYARQSIGLGLAVEKFGAQFFGDGATPSGVLATNDNLSLDQAKELLEVWKGTHGKRRTPAVIAGGLKWEGLTIAPEESQFIETVKLNVAQICRVFGVPPEMIGAESGQSLTYANIESRALHFLKFSLNPWLVRLEAALGRLLPRNQYVKFNTGGLLKADTKTRYEAHAIALKAGFLTVNEVRELEDRPPLPGGDTPPAPSGNGHGTVTDTVAVA
jgi:HK97 family phage portal protein